MPEPEEPEVPRRAPTAGDALLGMAPAGADIVIEIDIDRLRTNNVVGPAVAALAGRDAGPTFGLDFDLFRDADTVMLASYDVGSDEAATVTLIRGEHVGRLPAGTEVDERTRAIGPEELLARVAEVAGDGADGLEDDPAFLRLRAHAMPAAAPGASLRLTARLDFDARVSLAHLLRLETVPVSLSVWGDVVDDLAIVALMAGDSDERGVDLVEETIRLRDRLVADPLVRRYLLTWVVGNIEVAEHGAGARAVLVISPTRLQRLVTALTKRLGES